MHHFLTQPTNNFLFPVPPFQVSSLSALGIDCSCLELAQITLNTTTNKCEAGANRWQGNQQDVSVKQVEMGIPFID